MLRTFPLFSGAVSVSQGAINLLGSLTANVQGELNRIFLGGASGTASGTVYYSRDSGMLASLSMSEFARTSISETFHKAVVFEEFVTLRQGIGGGVVNLGTLSGTLNIDPALGNYFCVVMAGDIPQVSIGAAISVGQVLSIRFQHNGTGGWEVTNWPAAVLWADNTTFNMRETASSIHVVTMVRDPLSLWLAAAREFG